MHSVRLTRPQYNTLSAQLGGKWLYWSGVVTRMYDSNLEPYPTTGHFFGSFLAQGEEMPETPHEYPLGAAGEAYMLPRQTVLLQLAEGHGQWLVVTDDAVAIGDLVLESAGFPPGEWKRLDPRAA